MKFYVLVGSMALMLFVTGCANDTAIYADPHGNGHAGANGAPPEEGTPPPNATETNTPPAETESTKPTEPTEPKAPPQVNTTQPAPWKPAPDTQKGPTTAAVSYPKATRVPGKANRVISPYAPYAGEVDVGGFASGDQVKCPYTGKIFIVP